MFWSKNNKNVYPCKPQFYYIKVECKGVFITRTCFRDVYDGSNTYNKKTFRVDLRHSFTVRYMADKVE